MISRLLAVALVMLTSSIAFAETIYRVAPHADVPVLAKDSAEKTLPNGVSPNLVVNRNGVKFNVWFEDIIDNNNKGFDSPVDGPAARARFEDALKYVADVINESGELDILVEVSLTNGTGALASAGTYYSNAAAFQDGSTLTRLKSGAKPFTNTEEIVCRVDFGYDWNFGTGDPANNEADFQSVLTHELTHGLGFASLSSSNGNSQIPGVFTRLDQQMRRRTGNKVLFSGNPPSFVGVGSDLVSNDLFFNGTQANILYAQPTRPGLFAPSPFQLGSSLSHWDTNNIVGGAVMEHAISFGEQHREYAPVDIGGLVDIGYVNAADPNASPANLSVSPSGTVNLGSSSIGVAKTQNFTIQNTGGGTIVGTASVGAGPFSVTAGANFTLGAGASTTVTVRFLPAALGLVSGTLTLTGDPDGNTTVTLNGTGVAATPANLTVSPAGPVNFGSAQLGNFINQTFTVNNTGGTAANMTASVNGAPFSVVSGTPANIPAGGSANVVVRFSPTVAGAASKTLSIAGDPDGALTVTLNGTGVELPGNLSTTPDISGGIDMGEVPTDASSTLAFTLKNDGGQTINGTASVNGAPFNVSTGANYSLPAGQSVVVTVNFVPTETGDFSGTLTLTGDPDGNIVSSLIGTGVKAGNAACGVEKGSRGSWSLGDAALVALCGAGLVLARRRMAGVRA